MLSMISLNNTHKAVKLILNHLMFLILKVFFDFRHCNTHFSIFRQKTSWGAVVVSELINNKSSIAFQVFQILCQVMRSWQFLMSFLH